jgi:RNA polymerase sigma-70 factor (ECF subfamily)
MVLEHREKNQRMRRRFDNHVLDSLAQEAQVFADEDSAKLAAMRTCIDQLPVRQQEIVRRRYFDGDEVGTIAKSTGQSANALANSLFRIRRALWDCIHRRLTAESEI